MKFKTVNEQITLSGTVKEAPYVTWTYGGSPIGNVILEGCTNKTPGPNYQKKDPPGTTRHLRFHKPYYDTERLHEKITAGEKISISGRISKRFINDIKQPDKNGEKIIVSDMRIHKKPITRRRNKTPSLSL